MSADSFSRKTSRPIGGIAILTGYRDLYHKTLPIVEIRKSLWRLPKTSALLYLARISAGADDMGGVLDGSKAIFESLPDLPIKRKWDRLFYGCQDALAFHPLQILNAQRLILANPADDYGELVELSKHDIEFLITSLLALNDHLVPNHDVQIQSLYQVIPQLLPSLAFDSADENWGRLMGRYHYLYFEIPAQLRNSPEYVDIASSFRSASGVDLDVFTCVAWSVITASMNPTRFRILPKTWFSNTGFTDSVVDGAIKSFSNTEAGYRSQITDSVGERFCPFDLGPFRESPVFRDSQGNIFPLSRRLLVEKTTSGVFWEVADYWKPDNIFRTFWGHVVEQYSAQLFGGEQSSRLKGMYCSLRYDGPGGSEKRASDLVFSYDDSLVLAEIKSGRIRRETKETGSLVSLDYDLDTFVLPAIQQLRKVEDDYNAGMVYFGNSRVDEIHSVLVMVEPVPMTVATMDYVAEKAIKSQACTKQFADRLSLIDIGELEMLAALAERKYVISRIIRRWKNSSWRFQPLSNFLHAEWPRDELVPRLVREGAAKQRRRITSLLFPN